MKHLICVKDEKLGKFHTPVFSDSVPQVIRELIMVIRENPKSLYTQFPADYSVWRLGSFQEDSGVVEPLAGPEHLFNMTELLQEAKNGKQ